MELSQLLKVPKQKQLKNRTIFYLTIALVVQVFFWYFSMPGPQLAKDFEASFSQGTTSCFVAAGCLLVIPLACILIMRDDLARFGLGWGDVRYGLMAVLFVTPIFVIATCIGSGDQQLQEFYPLAGNAIGKDLESFGIWILAYACFYISFEFFYRGFLLFGADDLDLIHGFLLQLACCVLIHAGKPFAETLASIPASILFAWITIRSRSIIYAFLIHFAVGIANDLSALWQKGELEILF